MNNYVGKICPYCKTEFIKSDEIVVCNKCEMPHHKDCWIENEGCTTFGCLGTIQSPNNENTVSISNHINNESTENNQISENVTVNNQVNNAAIINNQAPQRKNISIVYCTKCGNTCSADDFFCGRCGNSMKINTQYTSQAAAGNEYNNTNQYTYNNQQFNNTSYIYNGNYAAEDVYINRKIEYYKKKFYALRMFNTKASWNWTAFFFTPYWMIYRKMYDIGAGILIAQFILMLIGEFIPFTSLTTLGISITFGIIGNYLYMQRINKFVVEGYNLAEPFKSQHIYKNSGVNTNATIFTVIGYILLSSIISVSINPYKSTYFPYCQAEDCYEEAEYGEYCISHVCLKSGCTNQRISGSQYCYIHSGTSSESNSDYCDVSDCYNSAVLGGNYCILHTCLAIDCYNRRDGDFYCYLHE